MNSISSWGQEVLLGVADGDVVIQSLVKWWVNWAGGR